MRLNDGQLFPIPVMLPISRKLCKNIKKNSEIFLFFNKKK